MASDRLSLPAPARGSRAEIARAWLLGTFAGRALLVGAAVKVAAFLLSLVLGRSRGLDAFDAIGDIALVAATIALGYRLYVDVKRRLLWRVRRKLIVSYIFIGFVPVLLVVSFFLVSGTLLFFNVSAYMLRSRIATVVDQTQFLAQTAAIEVQRAQTSQEVAETLARRQAAAVIRYPMVSYALVPSPSTCARAGGRPSFGPKVAGPWSHMTPPAEIPDWVKCMDVASLITSGTEPASLVVRAVAWSEGAHNAVVVDIPVGEGLRRELREEMGITIGGISTVDFEEAAASSDPPRRTKIIVGPANVDLDPSEPIEWVGFLDYTDWATGMTNQATVNFRMGPGAVYRYLSGPSLGRIGNLNFGQLLLLLLAVVAALFLVIQAVAFVMGLSLARSITGSVHELFEGTERVRHGDFTHKIAIRSRDQLGELSASFNSMTASIADLLQQKAEKERLEQELRIARSIQMSLLPQASLVFPGVSLSGHCVPAREVGGDYYDFLPLDDARIGILIADVAGKGTSAALYMAELKGLMLSLSELHASPRHLLIAANRIISKHLDARSFITMMYAVVDLRARTVTLARAGHCPLVYVPGPYAVSRAPQTLQPDGMVLGLQFDTGDLFSRTLVEVTLPVGFGDLFLLYTDGISEAMNVGGDCFGDARLADLACLHADLASDDLRDCILGEVRAFAGSAAQHDDMTMVLLKIGSGSVVVVFTTSSDIEASVVMALLDSHGIEAIRASGNTQGIWPMTVSALGEIRVAVADAAAEEARRIIDSHRQDVGARVVRLRDEFDDLQARIDYRFRDRGLLEHALTHKSRAAEDASGGVADNESLEFLGDAVLGLVVADTLFHQYPTYDEGQKSKIKAAVVSTQSLARHAEQLRLGEHLILGRGEEKTGGRFKQALLADGYEALIAAIYLDGGLEAAEAFLRRELKDAIDEGSAQTFARDYKSALQEQLQALGRPLPEYRVSGEAGPDHRKTFSVEVVVGGEVLGAATGRAKKEAEQEAAREALARLASTPNAATPNAQPFPTPNIQLLPTPKDPTPDE